jgi:hypothetical protein
VLDGPVAGVPAVPETEHPAGALYQFAHFLQVPTICVTPDVASHLGDARTPRRRRDAIHASRQSGHTLIMVNCSTAHPAAVTAEATRLEPSLPDETELERTVPDTVRRIHKEQKIEVGVSRGGLRVSGGYRQVQQGRHAGRDVHAAVGRRRRKRTLVVRVPLPYHLDTRVGLTGSYRTGEQ